MIKEFLKNKSGNFASILAIASLPVMLGIGVAVDYSSVSQQNTKLQNSLDSAILAVGIDFPSMSEVQVRKILTNYLRSNLSAADYAQIKNLHVKPNIQDRTLTVTAKAEFTTNFMMLAGVDKLPHEAEAQIKSASGGAEIAFVLDNTGSMNIDGKLDALKEAAKNFTNAMMKKNSGGDVKIGIVPFSNYVNVGMSNRNASWLDVPDDSSTTDDNFCHMTSDVITGSCTTQNGINSEGQSYTYQQCSYGT
ncbi:MAG: pilus assembly protein TadG-related protein, partial [Salaquimonas sp.]